MKELLTGNLPVSFLIGGREYPISSDFGAMLKLEEIFSSEELTDEEKAAQALKLFYGCIPEPLEEAVAQMCLFWRCGRQEQEGRGQAVGEGAYQPPIYSFTHDAGLIYGAFLTQYGIDLSRKSLHWWQFMALFESLEDDRVLKEVMRCRAVEIKGDMPQAQKDYYNAMKRRYAMPLPEQEERQQSALVTALMGDGKVDEVMACMKKK
jgi:hypothetical protein